MLAPNTVLHNRYQIVRQLGQGGMGAVYEATDRTFGSTVALKETLIVDEHLRKAFEREARLLNSLHHAGLPHVFDYFFEGDGQFLVMQYIQGADLGQQLKRTVRVFPPEQVFRWTDQLLDLLDYLHSHEPPIVHRDIKPENLKLTQRGDVILLDFGLAKGAVDQMTQVSNKSLFGYTPHYAPFEQIRGTGTDGRSDLYSLAATAFHLVTGNLPPDSLTRAESVLNGEPDPLTNLPLLLPMVAPSVASVLERALAQKRDNRYASAAAMRADLQRALKSVPPTVKVAVPQVPQMPTMIETAQNFHAPPPPQHPSTQPPTTPLFASNPQPPPVYPSNPPRPAYPSDPSQAPQNYSNPVTPSFPPPPPTMHAGYPSQAVMGGRKQGNAKLWIGLAVAALLMVAVAAIAALLVLPRLLNPEASNANTNTANANANTNTGRETSGGPKTLADAGTLNAPSTVLRVAFSADGKYIASSADETTIRLWNAGDRSLVRELTGQGAPSRGLDVSPDGVFVAAGADNGMLRIWKIVDGTEVSSFKAHDTPIFLLAYSIDGSKIVTAATDRTVKVWRASDGVSTKTVTPPSPDDSIIDVSPNLAYVAFYGADKGVTVVSLDANRPVATLSGHNYDLRAGAFSPDGELLALGSTDGTVRLWDATSGKMVRELKAGSTVSRLRFSSDGKLLASGSADGSVRLWNPGDGSKLFEATAHTKTVNGIAFSADGRSLATGSADKTIRLWNVVEKKP